MSFLLLENRLSIDTLVVPGYFIDRFLPAASGTDVKVYLYLLRAVSTSATGLSSASISDRLDISEREVLRSLSYWESVGLMRLSFTSGHVRRTVMWGIPLDVNMFLVCGICAVVSMVVGLQVFRKTQDHFVLHI